MNKEKRLLSKVRESQRYLAIIAEVLILLSFAMSGLDVSVGGKLAVIPGLAWAWGVAFALGIDTSFVLAWVRVRQMVMAKRWASLLWGVPLALGMAFIVFQPVAIQQLQQSMGISFNDALGNLGINLGFLVYARSGVAVLLGAVLAMTNVEQSNATLTDEVQIEQVVSRFMKQSVLLVEPLSDTEQVPEQAQSKVEQKQQIMEQVEQILLHVEQPVEQVEQVEQHSLLGEARVEQAKQVLEQTEQVAEQEWSKVEQARHLLEQNPKMTERAIAAALGVGASTAHRLKKEANETRALIAA